MVDLEVRPVIRHSLTAGVMISSFVIAAGLLADKEPWITSGLFLLICTPVLRVLILAGDYLRRKDWFFLAISAGVLAMMLSGIGLARR